MARHDDIEVRALGNVAEKVADARIQKMMGLLKDSTDEERIVAAHVIRILDYLMSGENKPVNELDEIWASMVWLDSQVRGAGIEGPGWVRELVRGDHGR
jgi:uncharacterized protein (UPF0147 family)